MSTGPTTGFREALARCVGRVLGLPEAEYPDLPSPRDPWDAVRDWLAEHNLELVPVREPRAYARAGAWLALHDAPGGVRPVVMFGIPPGVLLDPLADVRGPVDGPIVEGWVAAPLDWNLTRTPPGAGRVERLVVAAAAEAPATTVDAVRAAPGGLEGDRYAVGGGTFSAAGRSGQDLTLIEGEALDELAAALGAPIPPQDARRNIVTRGIALDALIGRRFRVGPVECVGRRRAEPCAVLERLTRPGVLRGLVHRGGLRADIVGEGTIAVGDPIVPLED